ncbi:hypothetical protein PsW64_00621 [Pseudovibrio sp. W64]|uniref:hypothetical protein n=1 Tax=Pseudovibrio sp. W64 TaxID=1735583 RepID=UPI0007AE4DA1|nr:hypothetical protein [Pseudovibrio sp. W64]KZK89291.1 hypothetical protein PsW64_00621 [Pseudovibrio sp. W64]
MQIKDANFYRKYYKKYHGKDPYKKTPEPLTRLGVARKYLSYLLFYISSTFLMSGYATSMRDLLVFNYAVTCALVVVAVLIWPREVKALELIGRYVGIVLFAMVYSAVILLPIAFTITAEEFATFLKSFPWIVYAVYIPPAIYAGIMTWRAPAAKNKANNTIL